MALNFSVALKPDSIINHAEITRQQQEATSTSHLTQQSSRPRQTGGGTLAHAGMPRNDIQQQSAQGKLSHGGVFGRFLRSRHEPTRMALLGTSSNYIKLADLISVPGVSGSGGRAGQPEAQARTVDNPPQLRVNVALNDKGQAHFSVPDGNPPFDRLLNVTLGRSGQKYQGHDVSDGQQVLLDTRGRLVSLQQSPLYLLGMVNSKTYEQPIETHNGRMPVLRTTSTENHQVRLSNDNKQADIFSPGGRAISKASLPDAAIQSELTGVYRHRTASGEEALRLHEKKIYRHDATSGEWKVHDAVSGKIAKLSQQNDGHLYAVADEKKLLDLTSGKSLQVAGKISQVAMDTDGRAVILSTDETTFQQQLSFYPRIDASETEPQQITIKPEGFAPGILGLHKDTLYTTDNTGELFQARLPAEGSQSITFEPAAALKANLAAQFGQGVRVESLFTDDRQQMHAKLKDMQNQQHAVTLSGNNVTSSWSISDSMVLDNQKGLPRITPESHHIMDFGPLGQLALHDGKVHYLDHATNSWIASKESAKQLRRGQDGQPWILNDGELRRLKVNLASDEIRHDSSLFTLGRVKNSVKADLPVGGLDKKQKTVAIDALSEGRFVALNEDGEVQYHQVNKEYRRENRSTQTLKADMLNSAIKSLNDGGKAGKIVDMALGTNQKMYLLSEEGGVFSLPATSWQKGQTTSLMRENIPATEPKEAATSPGTPEPEIIEVLREGPKYTSLTQRGPNNLLLSNGEGDLATLHDGKWEKGLVDFEGRPEKRVAEEVFQRLETATKDRQLPGTRITVKREVNIMGSTGQDGLKVQTPFKSRIRAFLFKPTLETPRPLKNAGYHLQHSYAGREGLQPVYQEQGVLLNRLRDADPARQERITAARMPLSNRIDSMDWTGNEDLKSALLHFSQDLTDSASHHASLLGQHYGVLDSRGRPTPAESKTKNSHSGRFNPASSREGELTESLNRMMHHYPSSTDNPANTILALMKERNVVLNHQKSEVPLGKQRDTHDEVGLVKSQLILTSLTQADMHNLLGEMQQAMAKKGPEKEEAMQSLRSTFNALRDVTWSESPIKKATSMGFVNHRGLEANYDAIKSMTKAFSKEDHGVHVTSRNVMSAKDKTELNSRMKETILSLESGEEITFNRAYGVAGTGTILPGAQSFVSPGVRLNADRSYSLNFSRSETGINVSFGRNGGGSGTVFGAAGYNLLTDYIRDHRIALGSDRTLAPGFRLGGTVSAMLQRQMQNGLTFSLSEAELPAFLDALTEGNLDPRALMDKGMDHSVKSGNTMRISVDVNVAAVASVGLPITDRHEKNASASARFGGGVYAGANVLNGSRERNVTRREVSQQQAQSDNRLRAFNQFNTGANVAIPVGVSKQVGEDSRLPLFVGAGTSIQASVDNRTRQNINLQLKDAQPLADVHIDKLIKSLGDQFTDPLTNKLIDELKKDEEKLPADKLKALVEHFKPQLSKPFAPGTTMRGNAQRDAILQLRQSNRQQILAERKGKEIGTAEYRSTYGNLNKLDSNSFFHNLFHMVNPRPSDSNADRIAKMMDDDPRLKQIVRELQQNSSTEAVVTLELSEAQKNKVADAWQGGDITPQEIFETLSNSDNLRIKSIGFTRSQSKGDGFATPAFLLGGSNSASVAMSVNLGKINFAYGENQLDPTGFTLEGKITRPNEDIYKALAATQKQGFVTKG
ncbi:hypothetical protein ED28_16270 [[Pantoea] beijingensis]|uniref:AvrE-family type 3 secretion system effector n=1 Tax=[Pantoea] beijingensis TaxID=1324864 RepID=A0A443IA89_9GAMM|nr:MULTISPECIES: AvrE-family type 3 secretion system effector [Erwiniaceae]RWR01004.1 hypothetical protein ED28_16270 [[Pantoea] beijingensis]